MFFVAFLICFIASTMGAVAGFGGGVIIKPVMDAFGIYPVSTVSFMSGCTVLAMSVSSLIKTRNNGVLLKLNTSTPLAIGAALGGILGKTLLEMVKSSAGAQGETMLGAVQAVCLVVITTGVFLYICFKSRIRSFHVENIVTCLLIGALLGVISSFLGIGGGTSNVAILFLCFSMDAKEAAKNSIYIIMFSQIASITLSFITGKVPEVPVLALILMMAGGVCGALVGSRLTKKLSSNQVEKLLRVLLVIIILIDLTNTIRFFAGLG